MNTSVDLAPSDSLAPRVFPRHTTSGTRSGAPSPVLTLIVLLSTIGILVYSAFLLNPANRGDIIPYVLVLKATASAADAEEAWESAISLPQGDIDDGNSRTYMLAWIASQRR